MKTAVAALCAGAIICAHLPAQASNLSPDRWPGALRSQLERAELSPHPGAARIVEGKSELVAGTLSPIAMHAGMEALRQGGTAADAAIAVALTQTVTNLGAVVSYAGEVELVYYDAASHRTYAMDAGWNSWSGEHDPRTIPAPDLSMLGLAGADSSGAQGRKTMVPGFMAGMQATHDRFGRLPFADLFQPAIWYARNGVTITPLLAAYFALEKDRLSRTPEGARFLSQAGNALPKAGDRFVQLELARTLSGVAEQGARYMYQGPWAKAYVRTIRREGGAASLEDLRRYQVNWEQPLQARYNGAIVQGPGRSSAAVCAVLTSLNLLDGAGGPKLGPYWKDPAAFAVLTRINNLATSAGWNGQLLAFERQNGFASTCASRLDPAWAKATLPNLPTFIGEPGLPGHHSDSVVVVDRWGNVAALVHSINSLLWGQTGIVVGGIPISGSASINKARLATLAPGARVPVDMAPLIAFRDNRPVAAVASVGSSLHPETVRIIVGLLDGRDLGELAAAPPLLENFAALGAAQPLGAAPAPVPAGAYSNMFLSRLAEAGLKAVEASTTQTAAQRGTVAFVNIDRTSVQTAEAPGVLVFGEAR